MSKLLLLLNGTISNCELYLSCTDINLRIALILLFLVVWGSEV